ncbi:MAG: 16S rRNA (adenine(1518)-N(6)/adenine(1519)-N(6))-dimethyltransferase RsmA [Saprospiraceae bacterium]|nr:16S rRNA (adenine(1518)-N(6)/adenine(1519)-N(6))-dimethyltransferase RsmA [Saprospiraceae bacterium]
MRAKKSYGQHFLKHPEIAEKIAMGLSVDLTEGRVLEVGPGKGILTKFVADRFPSFKAVEADRDMVAYLVEHHPEWTEQILEEDFMKLDLTRVFDGQSFQLIGNFPYNISSQIIFRMIENREIIPEMVGMFQREVARRIVSGPGNKDYGILSVLAQAWYDGTYLFTVDRGAFQPPPKVQSGVIRLRRKENATLGCDEIRFIQVVKTAFGQRRKMMRNTLRPLCENPDLLEEELFTLRPEQLGVDAFVSLTNRLFPVDEQGSLV